eukprot:403371314
MNVSSVLSSKKQQSKDSFQQKPKQQQGTPSTVLKAIKELCFQIFRSIEFHVLLTNLTGMQQNEVKCMKLFINTLIVFGNDPNSLKLLKTRKDLMEYLDKEKMNVVSNLNQLIMTIEQRYDISKQMHLKNKIRKMQKLKVLFSSGSNCGKLLNLLLIIIENSFKQFEPVSVVGSPNKKVEHQRNKSVMFDFKKAAATKKPRLDNHNKTQSMMAQSNSGIKQLSSRHQDISNDNIRNESQFNFIQGNGTNNLERFEWRNPFQPDDSKNRDESESMNFSQNRNGVFVSEMPSLDQTIDNIIGNNTDDYDDVTPKDTIINLNTQIQLPRENNLTINQGNQSNQFGGSIISSQLEELKNDHNQELIPANMLISATPGVQKKKKSFGFNFGLQLDNQSNAAMSSQAANDFDQDPSQDVSMKTENTFEHPEFYTQQKVKEKQFSFNFKFN